MVLLRSGALRKCRYCPHKESLPLSSPTEPRVEYLAPNNSLDDNADPRQQAVDISESLEDIESIDAGESVLVRSGHTKEPIGHHITTTSRTEHAEAARPQNL